MRRVVITGIGLISPLGNSPEKMWEALASGTSGVRELERQLRDTVDEVARVCGDRKSVV